MVTRDSKALETLSASTDSKLSRLRISCIGLALSSTLSIAAWAQTSPPPSLGEETKGTPAYDENAPLDTITSDDQDKNEARNEDSVADSLFGTAQVTESRRENGQRYLIELEHSTGSKQYIEENDSDGKIESTSNDIEETPNLPKWKLGSW